MPGPVGIVPFHGPARAGAGGTQAITRDARRLAMFSSTSLGTSRFQRTVTEVSAVTALGWACDWSALRAGLARRRERASNRRAIRMVASVWEQGFVEALRIA